MFNIRQYCLLLLLGVSLKSWACLPDSIPHRKLIAFPAVVRSIETDWSFGGAGSFTFRLGKDSTTRTSSRQLLGLYSIRKQFILGSEGTVYFPGEQYILYFQGSYSYFPDKFWGIGPNAPDNAQENYVFKQFYLYPHLQRKIWGNFFVGIMYEYQKLLHVDYKAGGLFDQQNVLGRKGYHISGVGLSLTLDNRNHAFVPNRGILIQMIVNRFTPVLGSDYTYTNISFDGRKYIGLGGRHVLALQGYFFFNIGDVPLRSMASLGGSTSMRGYYDGRYRDKHQVVFQAEYRFPLFRRLGGVLFGNYGDVSNHVSDFDFQHFKHSYGGGLRFALNRRERLNIRVDYGWGKGRSHGLYFTLGEAF